MMPTGTAGRVGTTLPGSRFRGRREWRVGSMDCRHDWVEAGGECYRRPADSGHGGTSDSDGERRRRATRAQAGNKRTYVLRILDKQPGTAAILLRRVGWRRERFNPQATAGMDASLFGGVLFFGRPLAWIS